MAKPKRTRLQCYALPEVVNRLTQFQEKRGLESQSEALLVVLEEYFGVHDPGVTQGRLEDRLAAIEERLVRLEKERSMQNHMEPQDYRIKTPVATGARFDAPRGSDVSAEHARKKIPVAAGEASRYKTPAPDLLDSGDWLTTGELHRQLTQRGYGQSLGTLRRKLSDAIAAGELSPELKSLGVEAAINVRRNANPKDNSVRWLKLKC